MPSRHANRVNPTIIQTYALKSACPCSPAEGTYPRFLNPLQQTPLLLIDDWAMEPITTQQRSDLVDIIDARYPMAATTVSSQLSIKHGHDLIGESTYADAIMDRRLHPAQRIELNGESMRTMIGNLTHADH